MKNEKKIMTFSETDDDIKNLQFSLFSLYATNDTLCRRMQPSEKRMVDHIVTGISANIYSLLVCAIEDDLELLNNIESSIKHLVNEIFVLKEAILEINKERKNEKQH